MNNSHLTKKEFVDEINKTIDFADLRYEELSYVQKLEMIKHDIREVAIDFSRREATKCKNHREVWQRKLNACYKRLNIINLNSATAVKIIQQINEKIDNIKYELNKISKNQAQGAILGSKARWVEQGEMSSKYFFGLEKAKSKGKTMNSIIRSDGMETRRAQEILKEQFVFYQKLYMKDSGLHF